MDKINQNSEKEQTLMLKTIESEKVKELVFKLNILNTELSYKDLLKAAENIFYVSEFETKDINRSSLFECISFLKRYYSFLTKVYEENSKPDKIRKEVLVEILSDSELSESYMSYQGLTKLAANMLKLSTVLCNDTDIRSVDVMQSLSKIYELNSALLFASGAQELNENN